MKDLLQIVPKEVFTEMAKALTDLGVTLDTNLDGGVYAGNGLYHSEPGHYFRNSGYRNWTSKQIESIKSIDGRVYAGYRLEVYDFSEVEWDGDRTRKAIFGFFLNKI